MFKTASLDSYDILSRWWIIPNSRAFNSNLTYTHSRKTEESCLVKKTKLNHFATPPKRWHTVKNMTFLNTKIQFNGDERCATSVETTIVSPYLTPQYFDNPRKSLHAYCCWTVLIKKIMDRQTNNSLPKSAIKSELYCIPTNDYRQLLYRQLLSTISLIAALKKIASL